jgi:branched-chain amino acid transport system permease protein
MTIISPFWTATLIAGGINAVIATGLYVSNSAGALSVAHGAIAGIGGYIGGIFTLKFGYPFTVSILAALGAGLVVGAVLALATLRMNPLVAGLTTLAFGETMVVLATNVNYIGGAQTLYGMSPDTTLTNVYLILALAVAIAWVYDRSRLGLAARACRDNSVAANAMGIHVPWVKIAAFAIGAGVAAIGGDLRAHYILVQSPVDLGFSFSVTFVIFWVFGGPYVFWGPLTGALFLTILPEALRFSNQDRTLLYSGILVAVVVLKPTGLITRVPRGKTRIGLLQERLALFNDRYRQRA